MSSIHANWHPLLEIPIPIIASLEMDIKMITATLIMDINFMDLIIGEHVTVTQMAAIKTLVSFTIQKYPLLKIKCEVKNEIYFDVLPFL